jgi:hypothetical protein
MSTLRQALADYLAVRRVLGYKLVRAEKLLAQFLTYVEGKRGKTVGSLAFFPCADSAAWILCVMCRRRRPPFPP